MSCASCASRAPFKLRKPEDGKKEVKGINEEGVEEVISISSSTAHHTGGEGGGSKGSRRLL